MTVPPINSSRFDPRVCDLTSENSLFERKERLYRVDVPRERAKLVRAVIALANLARRRGEPTYLIFGLTDDGNILRDDAGDIVGIKGQFIREDKNKIPDKWIELSYNPQQQADKIGVPLIRVIAEHIGADPGIDYESGFAKGGLVSYLRIPCNISPRWHNKPFEIVKLIKGDVQDVLKGETCWIRVGALNHAVKEHERDSLHYHGHVPFVQPKEWRTYLNNMVQLGQEDQHLPLYCTVMGTREQALLQTVLEASTTTQAISTSVSRRILVNNQPGCGKTTALQRLASTLAQQALLTLENNPSEPPDTPIPIFVPLSEYSYQHEQSLIHYCLELLGRQGIDLRARTAPMEKLFSDKMLVFVVILDGFDEMFRGRTTENRDAFSSFIQRMHHHVVITSCRSTLTSAIPLPEKKTVQEFFHQLKVEPLKKQDVQTFLQGRTQNEELIQLLLEDLFEISSRSYGLEAVAKYLRDLEDEWQTYQEAIYVRDDDENIEDAAQLREFSLPTQWSVLRAVIPYILERELRKVNVPISDDPTLAETSLEKALMDLALQQVGRDQNMRSTANSLKFVEPLPVQQWLRWTGLLDRDSTGLYFTSELVRDYFAVHALARQDIDHTHPTITTMPARIPMLLKQARSGTA